MKNELKIQVTDRRLLRLQAIANERDIDIETLLYVALSEYEDKYEHVLNNNQKILKI